jgi:hypothetical protein
MTFIGVQPAQPANGVQPRGDRIRPGRDLDLHALNIADIDELHAKLSKYSVRRTWRYREHLPSPVEFSADLLHGLNFGAVAVAPRSGELRGLFELRDVRFPEAHGEVAITSTLDAQHRSIHIAAAALIFLDECFRRFWLNKVYFRMPASTAEAFRSLLNHGHLRVEGQLRDYLMVDGSLESLTIASIDAPLLRSLLEDRPRLRDVSPAGWHVCGDLMKHHRRLSEPQ